MRPTGSCLRGGLAAALALLPLVAVADASPDIVELDAARSHAAFRVKVVWLVGVRGRFAGVQGSVDVDRFRSEAVVDAHIDANSVHMNVRGYEDWVKSPEFFDAAVHPDIHFVSDPFPLQRLREGGELPGMLSVRGVSQPVRFELEPTACSRPGYDCAIVAVGAISRSAFGMRSRLGTLSDKVELDFSVYANPSSGSLTP